MFVFIWNIICPMVFGPCCSEAEEINQDTEKPHEMHLEFAIDCICGLGKDGSLFYQSLTGKNTTFF